MAESFNEPTLEHDHSGPDWQCEACKPLADVIRARMRWPSLHWGSLHADAFPSLARAIHEAGYALAPVAPAAEHTEPTPQRVVDAILGELPMSDDGTGHIAACGWDDDQQQCGCFTLRARIAAHLAYAEEPPC